MSLRKQWNIMNSVIINDNTQNIFCILYLMTVLVAHTMA